MGMSMPDQMILERVIYMHAQEIETLLLDAHTAEICDLPGVQERLNDAAASFAGQLPAGTKMLPIAELVTVSFNDGSEFIAEFRVGDPRLFELGSAEEFDKLLSDRAAGTDDGLEDELFTVAVPEELVWKAISADENRAQEWVADAEQQEV